MSPIFQFDIKVTDEAVDRNGHVNNVTYIEWLQEAAIGHAKSSGCLAATTVAGAMWVVRSHYIEYLTPAFSGDSLRILTWVFNFQKVRSLRKYKIIRVSDEALIVRAETDWVFVNAKTSRPQSVPDEVKLTLPVLTREMEP
jgi:acyl-CoA thioester hydrolase